MISPRIARAAYAKKRARSGNASPRWLRSRYASCSSVVAPSVRPEALACSWRRASRCSSRYSAANSASVAATSPRSAAASVDVNARASSSSAASAIAAPREQANKYCAALLPTPSPNHIHGSVQPRLRAQRETPCNSVDQLPGAGRRIESALVADVPAARELLADGDDGLAHFAVALAQRHVVQPDELPD